MQLKFLDKIIWKLDALLIKKKTILRNLHFDRSLSFLYKDSDDLTVRNKG